MMQKIELFILFVSVAIIMYWTGAHHISQREGEVAIFIVSFTFCTILRKLRLED